MTEYPEWNRQQLIARIHAVPVRVVVTVSGGGTRAIADLLAVPGASRTLLEAVVPYSEAAMTDWLGDRPAEFCSERTARRMAMAAWRRACRLAPEASQLAGIACTASLASDRPKRGAHRLFVALQTLSRTAVRSLELLKGRRSRAEEESLAGDLVLHAVAQACGLDDAVVLPLLEGEQIRQFQQDAPQAWQDLLTGRREAVGTSETGSELPQLVFPGAFNPIHRGHRRMAELASARRGLPVAWELSVLNVDKPPMDYLEMARRLAQFGPEESVWFTRAATFEEKSRLFPGATFVVGADTLVRIAQPRYYGDDAIACRQAIQRIASRGCQFLAFGRQSEGRYLHAAELDLPEPLRAILTFIPAEEFRDDISSTELRQREPGERGAQAP